MGTSLMSMWSGLKGFSRHLFTGLSACAAGVLVIALATSTASAAPVIYVTHQSGNAIDQIAADGSASLFLGSLSRPTKMVADAQGNIYYTEQYSGVQKIDAVTHAITRFNSGGAGLSYPEGMTFDKDGNLYVANTGNSTIVKYAPGGGAGTLFYTATAAVSDLAWDAATDTIYALVGYSSVVKVDSSGTGTSFATGLSGAHGLAFNSAGELFSLNANQATIVKFASDGSFSTVARSGSNVYSYPKDLAFDADDNLYLTNTYVGNDSTQGNIARFVWNASTSTYEGSTLTSFTSNNPYGLLVVVPEPASLSLVALGGLMLLKRRRRAVR